MFDDGSILPADPDSLEVLHDREYRVRAYRVADDELLIRGAVRDQKPPGLYLPDDPDPLTIHHMQVDLRFAFPSLEIVGAQVGFESHPHDSCPRIVDHYHHLVGLSITRGFTHRVRDLFGGPRGCTHTTALLQAMAPVAVQCFWSMRPPTDRQRQEPAEREEMWRMNIGSCHVWAADGDEVAALEAGAEMEVPVFMRRRLAERGLDPKAWAMSAGRAAGS